MDRGYKRLVKSLHASASGAIRGGIQGSEAAEDHGGISNVVLGVIHEYGAPEVGIPERSFLRSTYDERIATYEAALKKGAKDIYAEKTTARVVLGRIGERFVSDVKKKIDGGIAPELQAATIARKGSSKPLIDTGQLKGSITWKHEETGAGGPGGVQVE